MIILGTLLTHEAQPKPKELIMAFNFDTIFKMESGWGFYDEIFHVTIGPFCSRSDAKYAEEEYTALSEETNQIEALIRADDIKTLLMQYVHALA